MTRKLELCKRAAGMLRNADLCDPRQFIVVFGRDINNCDEHRLGKERDGIYRIDGKLYRQSVAMTLLKAYLDDGAYTLGDLDYLRVVAEIVDGNTSPSGLEFWSNDASQDCDNRSDVLDFMGKTSDDLFEDVLLLAIRQGSEVIL